MIKRINVFPLAEGSDPEKVWKYWVDKHAEGIKLIPGVKRYVINRVIQKVPGPDGAEPLLNYWGLVEIWFEDMDAYNKGMCSGAYEEFCRTDKFPEMVGALPSIAFVEEKVIIG
jgi:uncharacterized protein (TIGR02118 family)